MRALRWNDLQPREGVRTHLAALASTLLSISLAACGSSSPPATPDGGLADGPLGPDATAGPDAGADAGAGADAMVAPDARPPDAAPPDAFVGPEPIGTRASGVAVDGFAASAVIGSGGGTVSLAGGPSLEVPAGGTATSVGFGLRPAKDPPPAPTDGRQVLGGWYDVGADDNDLVLGGGKLIRLSFPVTPPSGATAPALHVVARLFDGVLYPLDGVYQAGTGRFVVEVPGLPPFATMAVVHLPGMRREASGGGARLARPATTWPTIDFTIDHDGNAITVEQARKVLTYAARAAETYSGAGLREPFLYRDAAGWRVHLVPADGSSFDPNHDPASPDAERHFGRLYVDVNRIDAPRTDVLGSLQSSLAHEMLHAVFHSYHVPRACLNVVRGGVRYCYPTSSGFDEGIATAVGYYIDQERADPRPSTTKLPLSEPPGTLRSGDMGLAYRNQDFIVYVLRKVGLAGVRTMLESLAAAPALPATTVWDILDVYHAALEAKGVGTGLTFSAFYTGYVVDRGYQHSAAGRIWPGEPTGGAVNTMDPALFDAPRAVLASECRTQDRAATCTVNLAHACPLCARVVTVNLAGGVGVPEGLPPSELLGSFYATGTGAATLTTMVAAFGENGGVGNSGAQSVSLEGGAGLGGMLFPYSTVRVITLQHGAGDPTVRLVLWFRPLTDLYTTTRGALRLGFLRQTVAVEGPPICGSGTSTRQVSYSFEALDGTWADSTYTGAFDRTFPPGSFGGHRREQLSFRATLDLSASRLLSFELDSKLTGYYDDAEGTISTNDVHIVWHGPPVPFVAKGLYNFNYFEIRPISDADFTLTDEYSSNTSECVQRVIANDPAGPTITAVLVGFAP